MSKTYVLSMSRRSKDRPRPGELFIGICVIDEETSSMAIRKAVRLRIIRRECEHIEAQEITQDNGEWRLERDRLYTWSQLQMLGLDGNLVTVHGNY